MSDTTQRPTLAACVEHGVITFEQAVRILEDRGYRVRHICTGSGHKVIAVRPDTGFGQDVWAKMKQGSGFIRLTAMVNFLKANDL